MNIQPYSQVDRESNFLKVLTPRERQTFELLTRGRSYKEIARAMRISVNGVKFNIRNIYQKLGVNSRAEAVFVALLADNKASSRLQANTAACTLPDEAISTNNFAVEVT